MHMFPGIVEIHVNYIMTDYYESPFYTAKTKMGYFLILVEYICFLYIVMLSAYMLIPSNISDISCHLL